MRKIIFTIIAIGAAIPSFAQQSTSKKVPETVKAAFQAKFPGATAVEWEKERANEWEAEFQWKGKEYSSNFNSDGKWLETEYEIKKSEIPPTVLAIVNEHFSDYEIEEAEIAETESGEFYELEIEVGDKEFEVTIDSNGKLTKESEDDDDDDED